MVKRQRPALSRAETEVLRLVWQIREATVQRVYETLPAHRKVTYVTVATLPVPLEGAGDFGIVTADPDGRIRAFHEKPERPEPMPGDPRRAYASMGNYLFNTECLVRVLREVLGLPMQGKLKTQVSMYGNRYPIEDALKLFGALEGVGAQAPK